LGATAFTYPVAVDNRPSRHLAESLGGVLVGHRELRKTNGVVLPEVVYRIPATARANPDALHPASSAPILPSGEKPKR
jgi:hypothetical protein